LTLVGWYISPDIQAFIKEFTFASFSFSFIPFKKLPVIKYFYNFLKFQKQDNNFSSVGLDSESTAVNNFGMFTTLFWII